jgi:hypothetical protein
LPRRRPARRRIAGEDPACFQVERYGEKCAEVEAVPADVLRDMVEGAIKSHIPANEWARLQAVEQQERQAWQSVMGKVGAA